MAAQKSKIKLLAGMYTITRQSVTAAAKEKQIINLCFGAFSLQKITNKKRKGENMYNYFVLKELKKSLQRWQIYYLCLVYFVN